MVSCRATRPTLFSSQLADPARKQEQECMQSCSVSHIFHCQGCSSPEDIPLGRGCCLGRLSSVEEGLELIEKSSDDNLAAAEEKTPMTLVARIEDSVVEILREPKVKTSQGGLPDSFRRNMETQL